MNDFDGALNKSLDDFMEYYKMVDTKEIYSNGTEFVPIFRVKQWEEYNKDKEIERLNKKIEQYENPEDMTLMFMWCNEKAKDEIKRLNNIINELEKYINEEYIYDELGMKIFDASELQDKLQELKGDGSNGR